MYFVVGLESTFGILTELAREQVEIGALGSFLAKPCHIKHG